MQTAHRTLPRALRAAVAQHADRDALVDNGVRLSYAELHEQVRTTARALAALGVEPGDRIGIWAPNCWQWVVASLAALYTGVAVVPLNSRYTGHEAADIIRRTRAKAVFLADGFLGRRQYTELVDAAAEEEGAHGGAPLPGLPDTRAVIRLPYPQALEVRAEGVVDFADLPEIARRRTVEEIEERAEKVSPDDVADILFTSGTTGRSKGACSAHRQTLSVSRTWARTAQVTHTDRYLVVNPFFHSFGYKAGFLVCLLSGAAIVPQAVFDVAEMLRLIRTERISILAGTPTIYQTLLDAPERTEQGTASLRLAVTGGTTVPVALVERMQTELGFDTVLTAYGLSEAVVATMSRPGDPDDVIAHSCGRVVDDFELRIAEPGDNAPLPPGTEGEVLLRGENVMLGYLDDPEATAEAIDADGWLHTGDIGQLDEQGYLRLTDRLKDMFIVGGFNVYPAEIEQLLARMEGIVESAVVGVPDARLGEVGRVYAVRRRGCDLTAEDVIAHCRRHLANFKVPRQVVFVDALPRNPAGKVLKRELRSASPAPRSGDGR